MHDNGVNVLLVEDNPADALLVEEALALSRRERFVPKIAERLSEAQSLLADESFDVILLDLGLPDGSGLETLTRMGAVAGDTPIIAFTGSIDDALAIEATRAGAEDYLVKGRADSLQICTAIRYAIERRSLARKLRNRERLLREAQRIAHMGSWEYVFATGATSHSEELERICGCDPQEWIERWRVAYAAGQNNGSAGQPLVREERITRVDGEESFVSTRIDLVCDARGKPLRLIGASQDITARRKAEAALQRGKEQLRGMIDASLDCIITIDHEDRILEFNPAAERAFGRKREQVIGHSLGETIIPPRYREAHSRAMQRFIEFGETRILGRRIEVSALRADGSEFPAELTVTRLGSDTPPRFTAFMRDLTEAREQERELERFFELSIDMICVAGFDGEFKKLNPAWSKTLGYSLSELRGRSFLSLVHPDDVQATTEAAEKLAAGLDVVGFENRYICKDGSYRWLEWSSRPVAERQAIYAVARDITPQREAAEELRALRRQSEAVLNSIADGVHGVDRTGRIIFENPAGARMLGWEIGDLLGRPAHATMHHSRADGSPYPRRACPITETLRDGAFRRIENEVFWRKDGTAFDVEYATSPVVDERGATTGAVVTFRDVTEKKRHEEQLRQREREYRDLSASLALAQRVANLGSWECDLNATGRLESMPVRWSDETFRIFGVDPSTFEPSVERFFEVVVHPDDREQIAAAFEELVRTGKRYSIRHRIIRPDGMERIIRTEAELVRDEPSGQPVKVAGTVKDITEAHEAERQLRRQASLIDLAHDAIIVRDINDRIELWNRGAEQLYGWSAEEVVGRSATDFLYVDIEQLSEPRAALLAKGHWSGELRQLRKGGGVVIVRTHWSLVDEKATGRKTVLVINTDITEQKKLQQQFLRAQRLESIGTLAAGVAHDLNNILVPILMAAPILRGDNSQADREKLLSLVEESAERGANIVKQVLTFARGADGEKLLMQPAYLIKDVAKIVEETFPKSIRVRALYNEDIRAVTADATQLHQVLLNLCVNARDAMPQGGSLTIGAENFDVDEPFAAMTPGATPGAHVMIRVTDTGTGIPKSALGNIFDPFFTTKEVGKGTGLGLSTVLGIVKSHGGFITVYSEMNRGTTFKVFLPASQTETVAEAAAPLELPRGNGETLLLVDDEPAIREVGAALLTQFGYNVLTAEDGPSGVALFAARQHEVDLVLTDMVMPFMDGTAVVRALRKLRPTLRIIVSTGRGNEEATSEELQELGIEGCIAKPYSQSVLLATLHDVLQRTPVLQ